MTRYALSHRGSENIAPSVVPVPLQGRPHEDETPDLGPHPPERQPSPDPMIREKHPTYGPPGTDNPSPGPYAVLSGDNFLWQEKIPLRGLSGVFPVDATPSCVRAGQDKGYVHPASGWPSL